ncbi:MAG: hypothetical protein ACK4UN_11700, partial [Limisphaerales bacterium]
MKKLNEDEIEQIRESVVSARLELSAKYGNLEKLTAELASSDETKFDAFTCASTLMLQQRVDDLEFQKKAGQMLRSFLICGVTKMASEGKIQIGPEDASQLRSTTSQGTFNMTMEALEYDMLFKERNARIKKAVDSGDAEFLIHLGKFLELIKPENSPTLLEQFLVNYWIEPIEEGAPPLCYLNPNGLTEAYRYFFQQENITETMVVKTRQRLKLVPAQRNKCD